MSGQRRLFFALWPDAATRQALRRSARQWSRRPVPAANLHMTLVFLGPCDATRQQCYVEAANAIDGAAFDLELDYLGGWARSRIQWLGTSHPPDALLALVETLTAALAACGFTPEKRRFVPHVTLARNVARPRIRADLPPLHWSIDAFVLAESVPVDGGVHYQVRERWALAGR